MGHPKQIDTRGIKIGFVRVRVPWAIQKALIRDCNNACIKCSASGNDEHVLLEMHHIVAVKDGGTNDLDNLALLCSKCHREWHAKERRGATWGGWLAGNHEEEIDIVRRAVLVEKAKKEHQVPPKMAQLYKDVAYLAESYEDLARKHIELQHKYSTLLNNSKYDLREWRISLLCLRVITASRWFKLSRRLGLFKELKGVIR